MKHANGCAGRPARFEGMSQDELGVSALLSGARIAWFEDPDGNVLWLTQW